MVGLGALDLGLYGMAVACLEPGLRDGCLFVADCGGVAERLKAAVC